MTSPKPPRKRPYVKHDLSALQNALKAVGNGEGWLESLGEVGDALKAWRADLVADLGGEEAVSAQERAVVELAVKTHLLLESVDRWLLSQPSLVNKSRRQLFPVVLQRQQLADALARYMTQLGLKRRAKPVPSLQDYLATRYGQAEEAEDSPPRCSSPNPSPQEEGLEKDPDPDAGKIGSFPRTSSASSAPEAPNPAVSPHTERIKRGAARQNW